MFLRALKGKGFLWVSGFVLGYSVIIRAPGVFFLLGALALLPFYGRIPSRRDICFFGLAFAFPLLLLLGWNWFAFGNVLVFGYTKHGSASLTLDSGLVVALGSMHYQLLALGALAIPLIVRKRPALVGVAGRCDPRDPAALCDKARHAGAGGALMRWSPSWSSARFGGILVAERDSLRGKGGLCLCFCSSRSSGIPRPVSGCLF